MNEIQTQTPLFRLARQARRRVTIECILMLQFTMNEPTSIQKLTKEI